jgi:rubredoxin
MPIRYRCKRCGAVLYVFEKIGDPLGLLTPREVALTYNFTCPVCKSQLNPDTANPDWREHIIVKPAEITRKKRERKRESGEKRESESADITGVTFISSTEFLVEEY